jgi:methyl-accepting chemotaxis protein
MLDWFCNRAPLSIKFKTLFFLHGSFGLLSVAAVLLAAQGYSITAYIMSGAVFLITMVVVKTSGVLIARPFITTVRRMEALADGDLESEISHCGNSDFTGRMAKCMQVFRNNAKAVQETKEIDKFVVNELSLGMGKLADGDLSYRISSVFPEQHERLRVDFNKAIDSLSETLSAVTRSADDIHNGAAEIRGASDDLSQRTEQQANSLEETAAAMNRVTSMVQNTAKSASQVKASIDKAHREVTDGGVVVENAVVAMGAIEDSAQEITKIINVIDGIAFQTNLLALNAGVEAARAGDSGKGFAVVANEVRALAQRSAEAARDIKNLIMKSAEQVEVGVNLVGATGSTLESLVSRVGEISELIVSISDSTEEQSTSLQSVNSAVNDMDKMTQQNAAMAEESAASARSLATEAHAMTALVSQFILEPNESPNWRSSHNTSVTAKTHTSGGSKYLAAVSSGNLALDVNPDDDWSEF